MNVFAGEQWRCRHRGQTCGQSRGRREWTHGESGMETYALPGVKQRASRNVPCDSGNSVQCSVMPRGVTRGRGGREVQDGEDGCIPTADL